MNNSEWVVLCLLAHEPAHGFALARLTAPEGPIGRVLPIPRPLVYRALDGLVARGLAEQTGVEPGRGPARRPFRVTPAGAARAADWLVTPVNRIGEIRTEFLVKLALLQWAGTDPRNLLDAQAETLRPIVAHLLGLRESAQGLEQAVAAWRYETAVAALKLAESPTE
ncbi:PadR family transcriptional regulator [Herbidospora sp. NEAU-GS84]|uniref:PadR family transcriptional regulator n=1 Tax=Herbidospora solisilvae TaxID=2696284 RepID=A0A7C9JBL3_9ACTN|nr:helix-turn-helix transcriptional regulator [Herbidospora solisilvae]NAS21941.1 PadR family transcriptional regulator [Herbidospora solisilvae]